MYWFLAVVTFLLSSSCATIFSGTKDIVTFTSKPDGASVLINGVPRGTTPAAIAVERPGFGNNVVTIRKEGFTDMTFVLAKTFNVVSIINLANIFAWGIDAVSGAMMKNDPAVYDLALENRRASASQALNVERVAFLHELPTDHNGLLTITESDERIAVINQNEGLALIFE